MTFERLDECSIITPTLRLRSWLKAARAERSVIISLRDCCFIHTMQLQIICKSQLWEIIVKILEHKGSSMTLDELALPSVWSATLHLMAVSFLSKSPAFGCASASFLESGSSCHKNPNGHTSEFFFVFFFKHRKHVGGKTSSAALTDIKLHWGLVLGA